MIAQDLAIDLFPQMFFMNNFSTTYARGIILIPSCPSRQAGSIHIFVILERSILNFDLGLRVTPGQGHSVT